MTEVQVFGDYILVTAKCESCVHSNLFAVSWKTGRVTQLCRLCGMLRVVIIDPDNSLIALIKSVRSATNTIRICKLKFASADPCLDILCYLRLPGSPFVPMSSMEWIPTSKRQDRTGSETSRGRLFPFRSYRVGTIWLVLSYRTQDRGVRQYSMFVSIGALLSVVHSGMHDVPWANWGPACTRILPLDRIFPQPAGPFWITSYAPLVVCDYDTLRARYIEKKKKSTRMSSIPSIPSLGPPSTKLFGEHWTKGEVKTHLPFRKFVASGVSLQCVVQVVADREWVVVISLMGRGGRTPITVYHVG
ncbi:hypothetical protein EDB89DRAFT_388934 [Lactarius sanguifluus]|nr:hypothetical protein EDB89DRAFT_388934 [Lactarius sanguifluus]